MTQADVEQACAHETISGGLCPGTTLQAYANLEKQINTSLKKKKKNTAQQFRSLDLLACIYFPILIPHLNHSCRNSENSIAKAVTRMRCPRDSIRRPLHLRVDRCPLTACDFSSLLFVFFIFHYHTAILAT